MSFPKVCLDGLGSVDFSLLSIDLKPLISLNGFEFDLGNSPTVGFKGCNLGTPEETLRLASSGGVSTDPSFAVLSDKVPESSLEVDFNCMISFSNLLNLSSNVLNISCLMLSFK